MTTGIAFIGFGEAGRAFARGGVAVHGTAAYDRQTECEMHRAGMLAAYRELRVDGRETPADALAAAALVLSLVTADQALGAAITGAQLIRPGALWLDMNSVAPDTKRAAARAMQATGGLYADVAIMAPVHPSGLAVPLLVSGDPAQAAVEALAAIGFTQVRAISGGVGAASAVKMIRSVMVKGLEALTAECLLAAEAAGVRGEVIASLETSESGSGWSQRADYALDRMLVHGLRRAAEMEEVVRTLDGLGLASPLSRAAAEHQRAIGSLGIAAPAGLEAKLDCLLSAIDRNRHE